jgi:hypothetical protein
VVMITLENLPKRKGVVVAVVVTVVTVVTLVMVVMVVAEMVVVVMEVVMVVVAAVVEKRREFIIIFHLSNLYIYILFLIMYMLSFVFAICIIKNKVLMVPYARILYIGMSYVIHGRKLWTLVSQSIPLQ